MPYIKQVSRPPLKSMAERVGRWGLDVGEMNYLISAIMHEWVKRFPLLPEPRYKDYNEAIGVLECVKLELYSDRGPIGPYEAKKKEENGAVP